LNRSIGMAVVAIILSGVSALPVALAQTNAPVTNEQTEVTQNAETSDAQMTIRKLQTIKAVLEERRERVRNLLEELDSANEIDAVKIRQQIAELQQRIRELTDSFERIALNGINLQSLDETKEEEFDWHRELALVARPILDSLKNATEKPRRIAELRTSISLHEQQLETTRKALDAISLLEQYDKPPEVADAIAEVAASWRRRHNEIEHALGAAQNELRFLEAEAGHAVDDFLRHRARHCRRQLCGDEFRECRHTQRCGQPQ